MTSAYTKILHAGRHPAEHDGAVNTPVVRTSTVISANMAEWESKHRAQASDQEPALFYGRYGTPTSKALAEAMAELEGGDAGFVFPSGVAACTAAILAFVQQGDHILIPDSVYGPVRRLTGTLLKRRGVTAEFYDPGLGAGIAALLRPETRLVYTEAPGSLTFEMQDIPAIAAAAHARNVLVLCDNTWATPLFFQSFAHGVDVSIHAATKYVTGHSDAMIGVVTTTAACRAALKAAVQDLGQIASPDDCYLALRGLRTMAVRLDRHQASARKVAEWLLARPEVARVLYPALPGDPGHALWARDFQGASGLLGFVLKPDHAPARSRLIDALRLFALGGSWGGYESLVMPVDPIRTATAYGTAGAGVRLHVGLEDVQDLLDDLDQAFAALAQ